jgi:hypothetical protein
LPAQRGRAGPLLIDIDGAAQKIFAADLERNFGNRLFLGV